MSSPARTPTTPSQNGSPAPVRVSQRTPQRESSSQGKRYR